MHILYYIYVCVFYQHNYATCIYDLRSESNDPMMASGSASGGRVSRGSRSPNSGGSRHWISWWGRLCLWKAQASLRLRCRYKEICIIPYNNIYYDNNNNNHNNNNIYILVMIMTMIMIIIMIIMKIMKNENNENISWYTTGVALWVYIDIGTRHELMILSRKSLVQSPLEAVNRSWIFFWPYLGATTVFLLCQRYIWSDYPLVI